MRAFVTGGSGYLGAAVVRALVGAGHAVSALARSERAEATLRSLGATPFGGSLDVPDAWRAEAAAHDALVHLAFDRSPEAAPRDRAAIETLLAAARGAGAPRSVVYTSGVWVLGETGDGPADEDAPTDRPAKIVAWRPAHERLVLDAAGASLATAVVRPGIAFGGRGGLLSALFESATKEGAAVFVGPGTNRWSLVHVEDCGALYRRVIEARARGIFHAVDDRPTRVVEIARGASAAAGKRGAVRSVPLDEARREMGALADARAMDQVVGARRSRELGWAPSRPPFADDPERVHREWAG